MGAAKWGAFAIVAGAVGWQFSPVYRGLTVQFKVFLQMSAMTLGGMIEADRRLIKHEQYVRVEKKVARDQEVWRRYQDEYLRRKKDGGEGQG